MFSGTNLQALIDAAKKTETCPSAEIALVISNINDVEGLRRAKAVDIKTRVGKTLRTFCMYIVKCGN